MGTGRGPRLLATLMILSISRVLLSLLLLMLLALLENSSKFSANKSVLVSGTLSLAVVVLLVFRVKGAAGGEGDMKFPRKVVCQNFFLFLFLMSTISCKKMFTALCNVFLCEGTCECQPKGLI